MSQNSKNTEQATLQQGKTLFGGQNESNISVK